MFGAQLHNGVPYNPSIPKKVWRKVRKTIVVDSRDRQMNAGSHSGEFTVTLPTVYQNVYAATLKSIELPLTFYQFSASARNVYLTYSYNGGDQTTIQIPDGNYTTPDDITAVLNDAFDAASGANNIYAVGNPITGRIEFNSKGTAPLTFYFTPSTPISSQCGVALTSNFTTWWGLGYFLGFTQTTQVATATSTVAGYTYRIVPQFNINLFPVNYVLMDIFQLNKVDETSLDDRKGAIVNGSFAKIICDGNPNDYIYLTDTGAYQLNRTVFTPPISKLTTLSVKFRLHDGRVLDFNGVENSFTIELELLDNNFDEFSSVEFSV
jgi:hypothetical protein